MSGVSSKIFRYVGSFYNLKFESESIGIIYLAQEFNHVDNPLKLIVESDRVLKNNEGMIIVGEHYISFF